MDPPAPAAATPALALASTPALAQDSLALPYLENPLPLLSSGQEVNKHERGACLWRPWLTSTNDLPRQVRKRVDLAPGRTTGAKVTKVDFEFHHPVRLFWPKSCSFDYLYSDGEILLKNFPVQATINLYEDSTSEEEEEVEEGEEEEKEEADGKGPEGEQMRMKHAYAENCPLQGSDFPTIQMAMKSCLPVVSLTSGFTSTDATPTPVGVPF